MSESDPAPLPQANLSIGPLFSEALGRFKQNLLPLCLAVLLFMVLAAVSIAVLSLLPIVGTVLSWFIQAILYLGLWKVALAAVDGEEVSLGLLFGQTKPWFKAGLAYGAYGFTVGAFFLLLAIPGLLVADRGLAPFAALGESYALVKPQLLTWTCIFLIVFAIAFLGLLCFLVGVIPASAFNMVLLASAYRRIVPRT